ncbi:MAG: V-type ATP synthase subunit F [bacterium]
MSGQTEHATARLIAMGGEALMQGFNLIGFETWPNADEDALDSLLTDLIKKRESALILLEPHLARCECAALQVARAEGGRIVIGEIPAFNQPDHYAPELDEYLHKALPGA